MVRIHGVKKARKFESSAKNVSGHFPIRRCCHRCRMERIINWTNWGVQEATDGFPNFSVRRRVSSRCHRWRAARRAI